MLSLCRLLSWIILPFLPFWQRLRVSMGKEDGRRWKERYGIASLPRPPGRLLWFHAASMGEALSLLPLVERIVHSHPDALVVMTTGTLTSARLLATRLPERVIHQFLPYDTAFGMQRFLDHWQPSLAVIVESEFWPNLLSLTRERCTLLLLNGRLSGRSAERWERYAPRLLADLLGSFSLVLAGSEEDAARLRRLGGLAVESLGNLKLGSPLLPADPDALAALRHKAGDRPRWLAASTHPGEETLIAAAHRELSVTHGGLLTFLVPRHAARGDSIAAELRAAGLRVSQRSKGELLTPEIDCYLADTMGELGVFYRLCHLVFIGGSLVPHGGQNPLEAARLDSALVYGPHMENFPDICARLEQEGASLRVRDPAALGATLGRLLDDAPRRHAMEEASRRVAEDGGDVVPRIEATIAPYLEAALMPHPVG